MYTQSSFAQAVLLHPSRVETLLSDWLADPITRLLTSSDRLRPADLPGYLAGSEAEAEREHDLLKR